MPANRQPRELSWARLAPAVLLRMGRSAGSFEFERRRFGQNPAKGFVAYFRPGQFADLEEISVESILDEVPMSRRAMERKFRDHLGRTVLAEIRRVRLEFVKALLTDTDLPMPTIAARSGFSGARRLAVVFRQIVGITPTAYRAQSKLEDSSQNET